MTDELIVLDRPDQIRAASLLSIRGRLSLEAKGLRFRGMSTHAYVKRLWGFKGNRQRVIEQFDAYLREVKVLLP